jgi:DNA-binding LytR/AlgR family response regulator
MVKIGRKIIFVSVDDITYFQSERGYLRIFIDNNSFLIKDSLKNIEKKLDPEKFVRINRSIIVNIEYIKELQLDKDWNYSVILKNNKTWMWGRNYRSNLKKLFDEYS